MGELRGFGLSFDVVGGRIRPWYVGADGIRRWSDNDEPCEPVKQEQPS